MSDLEHAKRSLSETLRDRMPSYWEVMKDWYKRKISKDDFDSRAKILLGENNIHLHNEFLFAILVKCQTGLILPQPTAPSPVSMSPVERQSSPVFTATSTAVKPPKPKKPRITIPEVPYGALEMMQYCDIPKAQLFPRDLDTILLCSHEMLLPDLNTLHTRMLLVAWEMELDEVPEEAAHLLMLALKCHLKNVLQALISSRNSWMTKHGTTFQHSFGHGPSSRGLPHHHHHNHHHHHATAAAATTPTLSSSLSSSPSLYPQQHQQHLAALQGVREAEAVRLASLSAPRELEPLNLFHLRDALKVNRHVIPVHSVYSFNMERILAEMWHPSEEEEEQMKAVEQWEKTMEQNTPFSILAAGNYGRR